MKTTQNLCGPKSHKNLCDFHIEFIRFINFCVVFWKITQKIRTKNLCGLSHTKFVWFTRNHTNFLCLNTIDLCFCFNHETNKRCFGIVEQTWTSNWEVGSSNPSPVTFFCKYDFFFVYFYCGNCLKPYNNHNCSVQIIWIFRKKKSHKVTQIFITQVNTNFTVKTTQNSVTDFEHKICVVFHTRIFRV